MSRQRLLLASGNPGKLRELRAMLADVPIDVVGPEEAGFELPEVDEDGDTFLANAAKKAFSAAEAAAAAGQPDLWALADDSGLSVDALDGAPGVYSARYAGEDGSRDERDRRNLEKLLGALGDIPEDGRGAHFSCVLAVAKGDELLFAVEGRVDGRITFEPEGEGGFGYDPIFYHEGSGTTFGCLDAAAKSAVSHRGIAIQKLREVLDTVLPPLSSSS